MGANSGQLWRRASRTLGIVGRRGNRLADSRRVDEFDSFAFERAADPLLSRWLDLTPTFEREKRRV